MPGSNELAERPQTIRPLPLRTQIERKLSAYALAASASGAGVLALAQPTEAKVVYTPLHQRISGTFRLDLNHDGVVDFDLYAGTGPSTLVANVQPVYQGNLIWGTGRSASALPRGVRVRPDVKLQKSHYIMALVGGGTSGTSRGPWRNATNRYLGLKFFSINGDVHYGWARITVKLLKSREIREVLTGYAYETVPGKPIITGKTKGPDVISIQPGTLGALAIGQR